MFTLFIANKNYSSWSLRPWILMHELGVPFEEKLMPFGSGDSRGFKSFSPSGLVPCLVEGKTVVWDSLGIVEYLAEVTPNVWPSTREARSWARSAAAEMHSGFTGLRSLCSMNCGVRVRLDTLPKNLLRDLERLDALWEEGRDRFGGPFLAGRHFTAVDAFFAPVAFRIQTYSPPMSPAAYEYAHLLLELPWMQRWYESALQEPWREEAHEAELRTIGHVLQDLRRAAP